MMVNCLQECLAEVNLAHHYAQFVRTGITKCEGLATVDLKMLFNSEKENYSQYGITSMEERLRLFKLVQVVKSAQAEGVYCQHQQAPAQPKAKAVSKAGESPILPLHPVTGSPIFKCRKILNFDDDTFSDESFKKSGAITAQPAKSAKATIIRHDAPSDRNSSGEITIPKMSAKVPEVPDLLVRSKSQMRQQRIQLAQVTGSPDFPHDSNRTKKANNKPAKKPTKRKHTVPSSSARPTLSLTSPTNTSDKLAEESSTDQHNFQSTSRALGQALKKSQYDRLSQTSSRSVAKETKAKASDVFSALSKTQRAKLAQEEEDYLLGVRGAAQWPRFTADPFVAKGALAPFVPEDRAKKELEKLPARSNVLEPKVTAITAEEDEPEVEKVTGSKEFNYGVPASQSSAELLLQQRSPMSDLRIKVCVRKRPLSRLELSRKERNIVSISDNRSITIHETKQAFNYQKSLHKHVFKFDEVFDEFSSNRNIYEKTAFPMVKHVLKGGAATYFAFGQTGGGKTFTLMGSPSNPGLYYMAGQDLLQHMRATRGLELWISYYELYNGQLNDLLNKRKRLFLRDGAKQAGCIVGLTESLAQTPRVLQQIVEYGNSCRTTGSTGANAHSSRSHAVLQMELRAQGTKRCSGRLTFLDLAGSERACDVTDNNRRSRAEGAEINQSLLALKECIRALDQSARHTPYRANKLTRLLRDAFSAESKTCMISCVGPSAANVDHTLNTLRYSQRVRELRLKEQPVSSSKTSDEAVETFKPRLRSRSPRQVSSAPSTSRARSSSPGTRGQRSRDTNKTRSAARRSASEHNSEKERRFPSLFHPSNIQCASTPKGKTSSYPNPIRKEKVQMEVATAFESPLKGFKLGKNLMKSETGSSKLPAHQNRKISSRTQRSKSADARADKRDSAESNDAFPSARSEGEWTSGHPISKSDTERALPRRLDFGGKIRQGRATNRVSRQKEAPETTRMAGDGRGDEKPSAMASFKNNNNNGGKPNTAKPADSTYDLIERKLQKTTIGSKAMHPSNQSGDTFLAALAAEVRRSLEADRRGSTNSGGRDPVSARSEPLGAQNSALHSSNASSRSGSHVVQQNGGLRSARAPRSELKKEEELDVSVESISDREVQQLTQSGDGPLSTARSSKKVEPATWHSILKDSHNTKASLNSDSGVSSKQTQQHFSDEDTLADVVSLSSKRHAPPPKNTQIKKPNPIKTEKLQANFSPIHPFPISPGVRSNAIHKPARTPGSHGNKTALVSRTEELQRRGSVGSNASGASNESAAERAQQLLINCHEEQLAEVTTLCKLEMKLLVSFRNNDMTFEEYAQQLRTLLSTKQVCITTLLEQLNDFSDFNHKLQSSN